MAAALRRPRRERRDGAKGGRGRPDDPEGLRASTTSATSSGDAMEPVLKPLVYQEALELVAAAPRARRAGLHRLGDAAGDRRGARGRARLRRRARLDLRDRRRRLHRALTPRLPRRQGRRRRSASSPSERGFDLAVSTAYSDSHTDLPFLEAVGNPVAVNPDRELRRIAAERGWPVLDVRRARLSAGAAAPPGAARDPARARGGRGGLGGPAPCGLSDADRRARLLRGRHRDAHVDHFLDAESRGKLGHGLSRIDWLETLPDLEPDARPRRLQAEPGYERWDGNGALGYLTLAAIVDAQLAEPPPTRASSSRRTASRPGCSAGTCAGSRRAGSSPR